MRGNNFPSGLHSTKLPLQITTPHIPTPTPQKLGWPSIVLEKTEAIRQKPHFPIIQSFYFSSHIERLGGSSSSTRASIWVPAVKAMSPNSDHQRIPSHYSTCLPVAVPYTAFPSPTSNMDSIPFLVSKTLALITSISPSTDSFSSAHKHTPGSLRLCACVLSHSVESPTLRDSMDCSLPGYR